MEKIHLTSFSRADKYLKNGNMEKTKFMELRFYFLSARACISATKLARTEEKCVGEFCGAESSPEAPFSAWHAAPTSSLVPGGGIAGGETGGKGFVEFGGMGGGGGTWGRGGTFGRVGNWRPRPRKDWTPASWVWLRERRSEFCEWILDEAVEKELASEIWEKVERRRPEGCMLASPTEEVRRDKAVGGQKFSFSRPAQKEQRRLYFCFNLWIKTY